MFRIVGIWEILSFIDSGICEEGLIQRLRIEFFREQSETRLLKVRISTVFLQRKPLLCDLILVAPRYGSKLLHHGLVFLLKDRESHTI